MNLKHIHSLFRFLFGSTKPITGPFKVHWDIESGCNSKCMNCTRWKERPENDLDTRTSKKLIDEFSENGVMTVSFAGNEPTLRKDLLELISYTSSKNIKTSLNTNAVLLDKQYVKNLCSAGLDMIYFSIDGHNDELQEKIRGIPNNLTHILKIKKYFKEHKKRPALMVNTVVNHFNVTYLDSIVRFVKEQGFDGMIIQPVHNIKRYFEANDQCTLNDNDISILESKVELILKHFKGFFPVPSLYMKEFAKFYKNPDQLYKYRCSAGFFTLDIRPDGEFVPCPVGFACAGKYHNDGFKDIWYGKEFNRIREDIKALRHPICWFACIIPLNIIFNSIRKFKILEIMEPSLIRHLFSKVK